MKKLANLSFLVLAGKLFLSPCLCAELKEIGKSSLHKLPSEMILAVHENLPKVSALDIWLNKKYKNDPEKNVNIRNTLALVCRAWHDKVIEFTSAISFPKNIGPLLLSSMEDGGIRIPKTFQGVTGLDVNNTLPIKGGIIDDILNLQYLTVLTVTFSNTITDNVISKLTNLQTLKLLSNQKITDQALMPLTALTNLKLCNQDKVTSAPFQNLTNLTKLRLQGSFYVVMAASLQQLTALHELSWTGDCVYVEKDEELVGSLNLKRLGIYIQPKITLADLTVLPKLSHLMLGDKVVMSQEALTYFGGKLGDTSFTRKNHSDS